jgi:hypothetical protein
VDEFADFEAYRVYNKNKDEYGAPIPGQFQYSMEYEEAVDNTGWVPDGGVDISSFSDDVIFIAAHAVMQWSGYDCDALAEIEAALNGD